MIALKQVPGGRRANKQRAAKERGNGHMQQAIREGRVKHHRKPVDRYHLVIHNFIALWRLHPTIGGEDPEGGNDRPQRHHAGGEEVQPWANLVPAKQHHP